MNGWVILSTCYAETQRGKSKAVQLKVLGPHPASTSLESGKLWEVTLLL